MALHAPEHGSHVEVEAHQRGDRIAGKPEDEPLAAAAEDERPARLLRHLPEDALDAGGGERVLHQVELAHRDAAAGEDDVRLERPGEAGADVRGAVAHDRQHERLRARFARGGGERVGVGVDDLPRPRRLIHLHQLGARGQDGDPWAAVDGERRAPDRGGHTQVRGADRRPRTDHHLAGPDVLARGAHVRAGRWRRAHHDHAVALLGVLDLHHGIGAARDDRAGEELDRRAGLDGRVDDAARGLDRNDPQACRHARKIGVAHGEAVHRRVGGRRDGAGGDDVRRRHAAERLGEHHALVAQHRGRRAHRGERLADRDHAPSDSRRPGRRQRRPQAWTQGGPPG